MIKLTDLLNEGKMGKNEINQELINVKNPKELDMLFRNMENAGEEKFFARLYHNSTNPKLQKAFFDAIKTELKRYPEGLV